MLRSLVPRAIKRRLRQWHRDMTFRSARRRLVRDPMGTANSERTLEALVYGWGNEEYSARHEYLRAMICTAYELRGPGDILECGSGLSTLALAVMAARAGRRVLTLEHTPKWAAHVRSALADANLSHIATVVESALTTRGEWDWYDFNVADGTFALVICDGPPGDTRGGRYGLLPAVRDRLAPGSIILLDDVGRAAEQAILTRWTRETGGRAEILGTEKPFGVLRMP